MRNVIIFVFVIVIFASCVSNGPVVLDIQAGKNTKWSIVLDEYSTEKGYLSYEEHIHGTGSKQIIFDNIQHISAMEYTGANANLEIYKIQNGRKKYTGEKIRTGRVYWWRYLEKVPLVYFE